MDISRPTYAEINLDALKENFANVRNCIQNQAIVCAVVKADAYGHGAVEVAKVLVANGAERLAVATLSEAIELRKAGLEVPIMILGYTPIWQFKELIRYNIIPAIYDIDSASALSHLASEHRKTVVIHVAIDTGMRRIGFSVEDETVKILLKISKMPYLFIEGIFSHFARADECRKDSAREQLNQFIDLNDQLKNSGISIPIKHMANSAAIMELPESHFDMVRPGIILYGLYPSKEVERKRLKLMPVMTLKTELAHVKTVPAGMGISYGHRYVTSTETVIGTLPIGYADGYDRLFSGKAHVSIGGDALSLVGTICMDQCMIELGIERRYHQGDEVILFGTGEKGEMTAEEMGDLIGTINYEITCKIARRIPRVFVSQGRIISVVDYLSK